MDTRRMSLTSSTAALTLTPKPITWLLNFSGLAPFLVQMLLSFFTTFFLFFLFCPTLTAHFVRAIWRPRKTEKSSTCNNNNRQCHDFDEHYAVFLPWHFISAEKQPFVSHRLHRSQNAEKLAAKYCYSGQNLMESHNHQNEWVRRNVNFARSFYLSYFGALQFLVSSFTFFFLSLVIVSVYVLTL